MFSTEFAIYNISGIQMNQPQILQTQQSTTIKSNQWPTGIYMLRLVQQGKSVTKKILIFDN
ncbi:MAG: T9SS type A sorting domain-containing protein [Saprospiraceae bacterium]|nr:T9SS type A sorting domain-containing protein [Saprospiraceae bacterium]